MPKTTFHRDEEIQAVISMTGGRQLELSRPLVMGILNVSPESFSDGSRETSEQRVKFALKMETDGADIIDIGGESTRPGSNPISVDEELSRVIPVVEKLRERSSIPISIDTSKSVVAEAALKAGADIVNDISALRFSDGMADLVGRTGGPVILMHMLGTPQNMQAQPSYDNCVTEIIDFFRERIDYCVRKGIEMSRIIIDPGIGFGKRLSDNLEILSGLKQFKKLKLPILIGASRKSFISMLYPTDSSPDQRLGGSVAAAVMAVNNGADIIRAHDVSQTVEALKVFQAIKEAR